jgi:hypothetical protein
VAEAAVATAEGAAPGAAPTDAATIVQETVAAADGGPTATNAGAPTLLEPTDAAPPPRSSWKSALSDDHRDYHGFDDMKSVDDLARDYIQLQGLLGKKGAIIPREDAAPDEWDRFYKEIGRPGTAEEYNLDELTLPEGAEQWFSEEVRDAMLPKLHQHGLTQRQVVGVLNDYIETQHAQIAAAEKARVDKVQTDINILRREWGGSFDANKTIATQAVDWGLNNDKAKREEVQALKLEDGSFMLDHPLLAQLFFNIGTQTRAEQDTPYGQKTGFITQPESAQAEIDRLYAEISRDPKHVYYQTTPEGRKLADHLYNLQKKATPGNIGGDR